MYAEMNTSRRDPGTVKKQTAMFNDTLVLTLLDAVTNGVMILNDRRQLVFANRATLEMLAEDNQELFIGLRMGEIFDCWHARESSTGCGGTEYCRQCGALRAMLHGLGGLEAEDDCRIYRHKGADLEALDLRVRATPFSYNGDSFLFFVFHDVSHEMRRRALERIFFHDILNTAGGLRGFVELLASEVPEYLRHETAMLQNFFTMMLEEIKAHKLLLAAESDELEVRKQPVRSLQLLESVQGIFAEHEAAQGKELRIDPSSNDQSFLSDITLLHRSLVNLTKNALEASKDGDTVTLGCAPQGGCMRFWVHNPGGMPEEVRLQVFKRSFSTKGAGRGLGTYSVKLLTERYLGGSAGFTSSEEQGTEFFVLVPLDAPCVSA